MKKIDLSEHFSYGKLLRYSLPSIGNMLVLTSFQVIDGFFVSNLLGVVQFQSVNLIYPIFMVLQAVGYMFGAGSSALVSQTLGKEKKEEAFEYFTMSITMLILTGIILAAVTSVLMPALAAMTGASEANGTLENSILYGRTLMLFLPSFLINCAFQSLWVAAAKPKLGLCVSLVYGIGNAFLDWLFMAVFGMGIRGAALATSMAATASAVITLVYFLRPNASLLRFTRVKNATYRDMGGMLYNGLSEMVEGIAGNFTAVLTNRQLLRYVGGLGVAANGVFNYVLAVFMSVFFGISTTTVSVAGYKTGQKDRRELTSLLKKDTVLNFFIGAIMTLTVIALAKPVAKIFIGYDAEAFDLTVKVLRISSFACLFYGFDIVTSSFFTGMGDGTASAVMACVMALIVPIAAVYLLPYCFGADAIWLSPPFSTAVTALLCLVFVIFRYPKRLSAL